MALAGRSLRRGASGRRWLIVAIVITLFVLLIDASIKSQSPTRQQTLSTEAWFDQIIPLVAATNSQGQTIINLRSSGTRLTAAEITGQLTTLAGNARQTLKQAELLKAPGDAAGAHALFDTCLDVRAQAAGELEQAMHAVLASPAPALGQPDPEAGGVIAAASDMETADRIYQLFEQNLPKEVDKLPASAWVPDVTQYDQAALDTYLGTLRNATNLTPVYLLAILAVSMNPAAVSEVNGVQILPNTNGMTVTIVVSNAGNQPENDLVVSASALPSVKGVSMNQSISLAAGTSQSVQLGLFYPLPGHNVTLSISVTPTGSPATKPISRKILIEMPTAGTAPPTSVPPPPTTPPTTSP